jgi:hypothetical protein
MFRVSRFMNEILRPPGAQAHRPGGDLELAAPTACKHATRFPPTSIFPVNCRRRKSSG